VRGAINAMPDVSGKERRARKTEEGDGGCEGQDAAPMQVDSHGKGALGRRCHWARSAGHQGHAYLSPPPIRIQDGMLCMDVDEEDWPLGYDAVDGGSTASVAAIVDGRCTVPTHPPISPSPRPKPHIFP
jgi:hypothetical protein